MNIYIKLLAEHLRKFSIDFHLMIENLVLNDLSGEIRKDLILSILDLTNHLTSGYYDSDYTTSEQNINNNLNELKNKGLFLINNDGHENEDFYDNIIRIIGFKNYKEYNWRRKVLGKYILNEDNFFKMVLILLRIRAKIPILIMGETGCGKTTLIDAIAVLNNYSLIVFTNSFRY